MRTMKRAKHTGNLIKGRLFSSQAKRDNILAVIFLFVPNLITWVLLYPGYLQPDHILRTAEFAGGAPSTMHSLLWTCLAFPFLYLSPSYAIYGLIQIAAFTYCAYRTISILKRMHFTKTKAIAALLFGLFPTFLLYNELYCSDVIFSYCIMLLAALLAEQTSHRAAADKNTKRLGGGAT